MDANDFETLRKSIENLIENDKTFSNLQMLVKSNKPNNDAKLVNKEIILTTNDYVIFEVNKISLLATAYGAYQYVGTMDGKVQYVIFCWV